MMISAYHRRKRLALVHLESRLAPANLAITSAQLMDNMFPPAPQPVPILGQRLYIQANWTATDTTVSDQFPVRIDVDGVAIDSGNWIGFPGTNVPYQETLNGWYATKGSHTVTVTLDPNNILAETNEGDNTISFNFTTGPATSPPEKFILPIHGPQSQTWVTGYYQDLDPRPGKVADYRGGAMTYDYHTGWDLMIPNYSAMDHGVPVFAAAAGTVEFIGVTDAYDRWFTYGFGRPINYVIINHGNGWSTFYGHLAMNSNTVKVGDTVRAGSVIGLTGSSGNGVGAHLHFAPLYRNCEVEPGFDLAAYCQDAPDYPLDIGPAVTDFGVTNLDMFTEPVNSERLEDVTTFSTSGNDKVYFWYYFNRILIGEDVNVTWTRPDNFSFIYGYTSTTNDGGGYWQNWWLDKPVWSPFPGTWQVALSIGGVQVAQKSFTVTTGLGVGAARVFDNTNTIVVDGRTTPLDIGTAPFGGAPTNYTFTIKNQSTGTLNVSGLQLPTGFTLSGAFPSTVAGNSSATFTVQLMTAVAGPQFGEVRFTTDDPETPTYNFNISGTVTGSPPADAPVITTMLPATAFYHGGGPVRLNPLATISDSNSANFNNGQLTVEVVSGGDTNDRLSFVDEGDGPGQIGLDVLGSIVKFGGMPIGTFSGGVTTPLVFVFNANATPAAVQKLVRALTYNSVAGSPQTHRRYVRLSLTDDVGLSSNRIIIDVIQAGKSSAPKVASISINGGQPQRSRVTSVAVTFSELVSLPNNPVDAFQLVRQGANDTVGLTASVTHGTTTTVTLTFNGAVSDLGSLQDGRYTLTIDATKVSSGGLLDGNDDGIGGDNYILTTTGIMGIYRLFGDNDGNGVVTSHDFAEFRKSFGTDVNLNFDFNNNGTIDSDDFSEFRKRFGISFLP